MIEKTIREWSGSFGKEYTERNIYSPEELDCLYVSNFNIARNQMNKEFLPIEKSIRILEVGCNVGNQLRMLDSMGYADLYGIELQWYAVEKAKESTRNINIIQGVADDIPFKDNYFDVVFTSGVLIHIEPSQLKNVMSEIVRCSKKYIWGFEYWSDKRKEVIYRDKEGLLWKNNWSELYQNYFPDLKLIKEEKYKYIQNDNIDTMFLLEK